MDPVTLGIASLAFSAVGTGVSAYGQYESSQAQSAAALYQAQVARNNQVIANQNASIALQQGQQQEQTQRIKTGEMIGSELASQGASGVNPNKGSSLDVRSSAAETGELDAATIRYNANLKARDFMTQASSYGAQAGLYSAEAGWDQTAGYLGMGSSILGGASSVSSKWLSYQQQGVFGSSGGQNVTGTPWNYNGFNV